MSISISGNSNLNIVDNEGAEPCMAASSLIWLTIKNVFSVSMPDPELTYQRKVELVSTMIRASFDERLAILENLGWQIDYAQEFAVHPKGQSYLFSELSLLLDRRLDKIFEMTCVFAETIGYRYEKAEGLFTNGVEAISMEMIGVWVKDRQFHLV